VDASTWVEAQTGLMITPSKGHSTKQNNMKPLSRLVRMIAFATSSEYGAAELAHVSPGLEQLQ
jgi:hypothetical protein